MDYLIGACIGLLAGAAIAVALLRQRAGASFREGRASLESENATLTERLAAREGDIARVQAEAAALKSSLDTARNQMTLEVERRATAEQAAGRLSELEAEVLQVRTANEAIAAANTDLQAAAARTSAELQSERAGFEEKLALLTQAQEQLSNAFKALSAQALQSNNQAFIELATQTLGKFQKGAEGELEKRQQAIGELVTPVKQTLEKLDGRIQEIEKTREGAYQALTAQVRSLADTQGELRRETANLVKALRQPAARGRWGELQLKRVVEMAGMLEHCDFVQQVSVDGEDGKLRPDLIVRLPGGKHIVVDAKAPLSAYLEAIETDDEETRRTKLIDHARQVRDHMAKLGRKSYQEQFDPTPDLVVLFLPGEMFFSAALQQDPELIEFGVNEKVIPATPTTLIALLRAVYYGWKQEALARNAQEISDLGRELFERIAVLAGHWGKVGRNLNEAVSAYNKSVGSLETRVLVSARRFKELKCVPADREIEELTPVDLLPRSLQAPELFAPATDTVEVSTVDVAKVVKLPAARSDKPAAADSLERSLA